MSLPSRRRCNSRDEFNVMYDTRLSEFQKRTVEVITSTNLYVLFTVDNITPLAVYQVRSLAIDEGSTVVAIDSATGRR